jgi:hypothetical protein
MQILNENQSPFLEDNLGGRTAEELKLGSPEELEESLLKHSVNGYLYCSGPAPEMRQGDRRVAEQGDVWAGRGLSWVVAVAGPPALR